MPSTYFFAFLLFIAALVVSGREETHHKTPPFRRSPYYQHLPECSREHDKVPFLKKNTTAKLMICPMFKDEEGFLSEWVAYYHIMGADHFIFFDDGSTDQSRAELEPWVKRGIVTIRSNWTDDSLRLRGRYMGTPFGRMMAIKALLESQCIKQAQAWGYDYYFSLDIDEYVVPKNRRKTFVDSMHEASESTGRNSWCFHKLNFQSAPHSVLEPVHLLQIEAYQTRMPTIGKMNYYTSVMPKCAYRISREGYTGDISKFVSECCHFHGCDGNDFGRDSNHCGKNHRKMRWLLTNGNAFFRYKMEQEQKNGNGSWSMVTAALEAATRQMGLLVGMRRDQAMFGETTWVHHYSRSLEKFAQKSRTWKTNSGELLPGQSLEQASKSYDVTTFMHRSVGWKHDSTAVRYGCQVRALLREVTGEETFFRHGDFWYRNPEFGRPISDPAKRGRYGRPNPPNFRYNDGNPYHYHGSHARHKRLRGNTQ